MANKTVVMNRKSVKEIRDGAIQVLNEYMKKFGYEEAGTGTTFAVDGSKISFKFEFITTNQELKDEARKNNFKMNCVRYGFTFSDYNALVLDTLSNTRMRLVGFNTRASKNPCILIEEDTNKEFVAPVDYVRFYMKSEEK